MESYVVSARKYRPTGFDEVVGQSHITTTLQNAIENDHLAQALLFCGPRGVGKTTCARILAKMVNEAGSDDPAQIIDTETALNIFELDAASNNSVDDIRNLIDQVRYPPQHGRFKIYIIDEVHMLSQAAFNAFLKTLEEPPPYAIFILATTEKHKVIPTILSRCQIYDFNRIEISDITDHLKLIAEKEEVKTEDEALHLIAQKADGALRDALSIFDLIVTFSENNEITYSDTINNLHILDYDYYFKVTEDLLNENMSQALLVYDKILRNGFDGHDFVVGLADHFRNLMMCKDNETISLLEVSESVKQKYADQATSSPMSFLLSGLNLLSKSDLEYKARKNQRLHVELTLMKIAHLNAAITLQQHDGAEKKVATAKAGEPSSKTQAQSTKSQTITKKKGESPAVVEEAKQETKEPPVQKDTEGSFALPSLSSLKSKIKEAPDAPEEEIDPDAPIEDPDNKSFSKEELDEKWQAFADLQKAAGKDQAHVTLMEPYELAEGQVVITLSNEVLKITFDKIKADLQGYLRQELGNKAIILEAEVKETEREDMIYTNKEKFNYLAKKHPALEELRNKLGLDPDY